MSVHPTQHPAAPLMHPYNRTSANLPTLHKLQVLDLKLRGIELDIKLHGIEKDLFSAQMKPRPYTPSLDPTNFESVVPKKPRKQRYVLPRQKKKVQFEDEAEPAWLAVLSGINREKERTRARKRKNGEKVGLLRPTKKLPPPSKKALPEQVTTVKVDRSKMAPAKLAELQKARDLRRARRVEHGVQSVQNIEYQTRRRTSVATAIEISAHPFDHEATFDEDEDSVVLPDLSVPLISNEHIRSYIKEQLLAGSPEEKPWVDLEMALDRDSSTAPKIPKNFPGFAYSEDVKVIECMHEMLIQTCDGTTLQPAETLPPDDHPVFSWKDVESEARVYDVVERDATYDWEASDGWLEEAMSTGRMGVFKRENWMVDVTTYNVLAPAMSLAWKLLMTECSLEWFDHVATGTLTPHPSYPGQYYIAETLGKSASFKRRSVRKLLDILDTLVGFRLFEATPCQPAIEALRGWGFTHIHREEDDDPEPPLATFPGDGIRIMIHSNVARNIARTTPGSPIWKKWVLFTATLLCHEVAHAFHICLGAVSEPHHEYKSSTEPYYQLGEEFHDDMRDLGRKGELGSSWEIAVIGLSIQARMLPADPLVRRTYSTGPIVLYGGQIHPQNHVETSRLRGAGFCEVLSASWVQKWFEESTWKYIVEEGMEFMHREVKQYGFVKKRHFPHKGWNTHYIKAPFHTLTVPAMINKPGIDAPVLLQLEWSVENGRWESRAPYVFGSLTGAVCSAD